MAYIYYSTQFVLDQFLTYIDVNQLGANCEHLANTLNVEHNWNIATIDGTHDWVAIAEDHTDGSVTLGGLSYWTPSAGLYQIIGGNNPISLGLYIQFYINGAWRSIGDDLAEVGVVGLFLFDGNNMRVGNNSGLSEI